MIRPLLIPALVLLASSLLTSAPRAETNGYSLISPDAANRYGLERRWFTQVRLAPGREGIVDLSLHVSSKQAQTLFRIVTSQGRTYSISERNLDTFGKPMGVDGAAKAAAEKVRVCYVWKVSTRRLSKPWYQTLRCTSQRTVGWCKPSMLKRGAHVG